MPMPIPTPKAQRFRYSDGKAFFLMPTATPTPTPTPTADPSVIITFTSLTEDNGWRSTWPSAFLGFSSCVGKDFELECQEDYTQVIRIQQPQNYQSIFSVSVTTSNGSPAMYQWQVRFDNQTPMGWTGYQNATEGFEFKDTQTSSMLWTYQGTGIDRRMAIRCVVNGTYFTKPIYYRYYAIPGGGATSTPVVPTATPASTPVPTPPPTYGI
jgi:hypothetical protein